VATILRTPGIFGFIVLDETSGAPLGSTCFLDIRPEDKHVEIGLTWYAENSRGTKVNPACKLALLEIAFEELGCERVTLKCDATNQRSRNAISKLGASYEGTLRRHKPTGPGTWRDTSYYSILTEEWPGVKEKLLARLSA
jgi:RimJ/RimL family protein N-acetyltransferase